MSSKRESWKLSGNCRRGDCKKAGLEQLAGMWQRGLTTKLGLVHTLRVPQARVAPGLVDSIKLIKIANPIGLLGDPWRSYCADGNQ
jgi:hypothetical protein